MEAWKQVTGGLEAGHWSETEWDSGKEIFWLLVRWLIIHTFVDKDEEWKDTFLLMGSLWKKFIIENWSFDFLSVLISFKFQLYSIQIKITQN